MIQTFDIHKIQKAGGAFNEDKLDWMNKEHLKMLPKNIIVDEVIKRIKNNNYGNEKKINFKAKDGYKF